MEQKVKKALAKQLTAIGKPDQRIKWVDPNLLTQDEQAAIYRELYTQHAKNLERQTEMVMQWRKQNMERHKERAREYYIKNKEKLKSYGKHYRQLKKEA